MYAIVTAPLLFTLATPLKHLSPLRRNCVSQCCPARRHFRPYCSSSLDVGFSINHDTTDALIQKVESAKLPFSEAVIRQMVVHLGDTRGLARLALVDTFGRVGPPAVPALLEALRSSPDPVVRRSCGKALAKIGDPVATDALLYTLVHDDDIVTRSSAAGALAKMGRTAVQPLLNLISDPGVSMTAKGHAAWAIAYMQSDATEELLLQLENDNTDVRAAVVSALGAVVIGDALPAMSGGSTDEWIESNGMDGPGRARLESLRQQAISALRKALEDPSPDVRAEAATALANAVCVEDAPRIAKLLDDDSSELRRCAALSLMKLGDTSFIGVLQRKSEDETQPEGFRNVARLAATALERKSAQTIDEDDDEELL